MRIVLILLVPVFALCLSSCSSQEPSTNLSGTSSGSVNSGTISTTRKPAPIIIGEDKSHLTTTETRFPLEFLKKITFDYASGTVSIWSEDQAILDQIKILPVKSFPHGITLHLDTPPKCRPDERVDGGDACLAKNFKLTYPAWWKIYEGVPVEYSNYPHDPVNSYVDYDWKNYRGDTAGFEISFMQFEKSLIIDIFKNGKYFKSQVFLAHGNNWISELINLEEKHSRRFLETLWAGGFLFSR